MPPATSGSEARNLRRLTDAPRRHTLRGRGGVRLPSWRDGGRWPSGTGRRRPSGTPPGLRHSFIDSRRAAQLGAAPPQGRRGSSEPANAVARRRPAANALPRGPAPWRGATARPAAPRTPEARSPPHALPRRRATRPSPRSRQKARVVAAECRRRRAGPRLEIFGGLLMLRVATRCAGAAVSASPRGGTAAGGRQGRAGGARRGLRQDSATRSSTAGGQRNSERRLRRGAEDRASPRTRWLGAVQPRTPSPEDQRRGEGRLPDRRPRGRQRRGPRRTPCRAGAQRVRRRGAGRKRGWSRLNAAGDERVRGSQSSAAY